MMQPGPRRPDVDLTLTEVKVEVKTEPEDEVAEGVTNTKKRRVEEQVPEPAHVEDPAKVEEPERKIAVFSAGRYADDKLLDGWDDQQLIFHLQHKFGWSMYDPVFLIDCWDFRRGGVAHPKCSGKNIDNMTVMLKKGDLKKTVNFLKPRSEFFFAESSNSDVPKVPKVLFVCSQGRHRSVTACEVWCGIFSRLGYAVNKPIHLSQDSWWKGFCTKCDKCLDSAEKHKLFDVASTYW